MRVYCWPDQDKEEDGDQDDVFHARVRLNKKPQNRSAAYY